VIDSREDEILNAGPLENTKTQPHGRDIITRKTQKQTKKRDKKKGGKAEGIEECYSFTPLSNAM